MVVAQIPLWMIHGTTPTGVTTTRTQPGGVPAAASGSNTTPSVVDTSTNTDGAANKNGDNDDNEMNMLLQSGRAQLNMWNMHHQNQNQNQKHDNSLPPTASGLGPGPGPGPGRSQAMLPPPTRRSAIYCCDISNGVPVATTTTSGRGRIATGGGDGKIRIWSLDSLFQTSTEKPTPTSTTTTNASMADKKKKAKKKQKRKKKKNDNDDNNVDDDEGEGEEEEEQEGKGEEESVDDEEGMDGDDDDDDDNDKDDDKDDDGDSNDDGISSKKRLMGVFKNGREYDSSDSSECASSVMSSGEESNKSCGSRNSNHSKSVKSVNSVGSTSTRSKDQSKSKNTNTSKNKRKRQRSESNGSGSNKAGNSVNSENDNDDDDDDDDDGGGGKVDGDENDQGETTNGSHHQKHGESHSSPEVINDISSLVRQKNDGGSTKITIDAKTGKKRKRAELIQVRPPPQACHTNTNTNTSTNTNKAKSSSTARTSSSSLPFSSMRNSNASKGTTASPQGHDLQQQRLLCTIASHSGSVLTLRFSSSGTYLASAGDDAHVLLYTRTNTPSILSTGNLISSSANSGNPANNSSSNKDDDNIEHWSRIRILRGHNLDVVGLAWAPDDSHLISCSLDSDAPICVWRLNLEADQPNGMAASSNYRRQQEHLHRRQSASSVGGSILHPYKILGRNEHTSTVKGVSFDPAGKYVASSGDDPAICIWRAFDDWGLEARVDSSSGVFRSKKKSGSGGNDEEGNNGRGEAEEDMQALANLSLFRRISFAPDGTHVCGTNATLRGKNIAAMISRTGWGVSVPKKGQSSATNNKGNTAAGAANLVGHKQPVVSSRHCPYFFEVGGQKDGRDVDEDDDIEPNYSTLVALGDKKGFVSIWSTKKSRPIFKLQCSESRCTVTDMAWGLVGSSNVKSIIMLVSLLDGFMVALKFDVPSELGRILSQEKKHRIFRLKYGIELGSIGPSGRRLVDDKSGPKLIENVLQYAMEEDGESDESSVCELSEMEEDEIDRASELSDVEMGMSKQIESQSKTGKKRIQPVLLHDLGSPMRSSSKMNGKSNKNGITKSKSTSQTKKRGENVVDALNLAEKAASVAEGVSSKSSKRGNLADVNNNQSIPNNTNEAMPPVIPQQNSSYLRGGVGLQFMPTVIPPKTNQSVYSVELQPPEIRRSILDGLHDHSTSTKNQGVQAICINSTHSPPGTGKAIPCATLSINRGGKRTWRDHILGTYCTSIAACSSLLAIGTFDGTVYLYGTSPTSGWDSGISFRSHAPFVMTGSVVSLFFRESKADAKERSKMEILVLTSDGAFGVYSIIPSQKLLYKGSVLAPMNQMSLSTSNQTSHSNNIVSLPELVRIFTTESAHVIVVLCHAKNKNTPFGGMIQGFVFNRDMEVWTRISDGRFVYSNFYTTVPISKLSSGLLSSLDETVKGGKHGQPQKKGMMETSAASMYYLQEDDEHCLQSFATRAHCEDRLACALALQSSFDFKHWFSLYIRQLCIEADSDQLRFIIDIFLNDRHSDEHTGDGEVSCWWLSPGSSVLGLNKRDLVEQVIIPEMSKNRSLQRLMYEISTELNST